MGAPGLGGVSAAPTQPAATAVQRPAVPGSNRQTGPKSRIAHERQAGSGFPPATNVPPRISLAGGVAEPVRRSDVQDSTHAVDVPVVALTADERGALRNHIALTLLLA